MLPSNVQRTDRGFTLIESLIIVVIIGILSAIAAPSFLAMLNRGKVNDALSQTRGALQEAQREAISKSKTCTVAITPGNQPQLASNCFVLADYSISASAAAAQNATTVTVNQLPVSIPSGTRLVFSKGATGIVTADALKNATSLTVGGGILRAAITSGETVSFRTLKDINIEQNDNSALWEIVFDFKGRTSNFSSAGTMVFSVPDSSVQKKCLVVSQGLGLIRTGKYSGTGATSTNCDTSE